MRLLSTDSFVAGAAQGQQSFFKERLGLQKRHLFVKRSELGDCDEKLCESNMLVTMMNHFSKVL